MVQFTGLDGTHAGQHVIGHSLSWQSERAPPIGPNNIMTAKIWMPQPEHATPERVTSDHQPNETLATSLTSKRAETSPAFTISPGSANVDSTDNVTEDDHACDVQSNSGLHNATDVSDSDASVDDSYMFVDEYVHVKNGSACSDKR